MLDYYFKVSIGILAHKNVCYLQKWSDSICTMHIRICLGFRTTNSIDLRRFKIFLVIFKNEKKLFEFDSVSDSVQRLVSE